jgi:hypothetical protein
MQQRHRQFAIPKCAIRYWQYHEVNTIFDMRCFKSTPLVTDKFSDMSILFFETENYLSSKPSSD